MARQINPFWYGLAGAVLIALILILLAFQEATHD